MNPGDVVRWESYPFQKEGIAKPRWLICMGSMKIFGQERQFFLTTTTTKTTYYEPGGKRETNPKYVIKKAAVSFFEMDCLVDFLMNEPRQFPESALTKHQQFIEFKGKMPNEPMRELFNALVRADVVNKKMLQILRQSLLDTGYTGLAKP